MNDLLHVQYKISELNYTNIIKGDKDPYGIGDGTIFLGWVPLYDEFNVRIGIIQIIDVLQKDESSNGFFINETATYHIPSKGTLTYILAFGNDTSSTFFKEGDNIPVRITSASGEWVLRNGFFNINVKKDIRDVYIRFNL